MRAGGFRAQKKVFLDARVVFDLLEGVMMAPSLTEAAEARFPPCEDPIQIDDGIFTFLVEEEFLRVLSSLRDAIDRYIEARARAEQGRARLAATRRQLGQLEVKVSHAERAKLGRLFKSKQRAWDDELELRRLKAKREELRLDDERAQGDLEKAGQIYRDLLELIYRAPDRAEARFYRGLPLALTCHGEFLLDYLSEMNPEHFQGRPLAEILEIGGALA